MLPSEVHSSVIMIVTHNTYICSFKLFCCVKLDILSLYVYYLILI